MLMVGASDTATRFCGTAAPPPGTSRPAAFDAARLDGHVVTAEIDEVIALEGDPAERVFVVLSGVVRLCKIMADGRRTIIRFLYPGDLLGPPNDLHYRLTAEAVTDVRLRCCPRGSFEARLAGSLDLQRWLAASVSRDLNHALNHMVLLGRKTATERVASMLLALARRNPGSADVYAPMSRLDMADHLGLTFETVSRVISQMRRDKIVALLRPQHIHLLNLAALRQMAGETADDEVPSPNVRLFSRAA